MQTIAKERLLFEEGLPGGAMWSHVLGRHQVLRVTDVEGGANVALLLYNADQPLERYNMPDTLKAQHTAFLTKGRVLYSDMGRVLCSMIEDSCGWHDTIAGIGDAQLVHQKYGEKRYQEHRNAWHRNTRDELLTELAKWGLGARDLVPNVNLFSKVSADAEGKLNYVIGHSKPGACVELRAEMNVLCVLSTCQHPLDPSTAYAPKPVKLQVYLGEAPGPDDVCRTSRPENARGFINTERLFRAQDLEAKS
jgi:urea carboxylase-associated protein 2